VHIPSHNSGLPEPGDQKVNSKESNDQRGSKWRKSQAKHPSFNLYFKLSVKLRAEAIGTILFLAIWEDQPSSGWGFLLSRNFLKDGKSQPPEILIKGHYFT
jgi:hypothetical protein